MSHDITHGGLHKHSIGEIYPWSVVQVGDKYCQARNGITGERSPEFKIPNMVGIDSSVSIRHTYRTTERWASDKIAAG